MKKITTEDVKAWKEKADKQGPSTSFDVPMPNGWHKVMGIVMSPAQYKLFQEELLKQGVETLKKDK